MAEPRKEIRQVSTQVNDEEASYLQSLGLKTLLEKKVQNPVKKFWANLVGVNSAAWPIVSMVFALLFAVTAGVALSKASGAGEAHVKEARQLIYDELPATERDKMLLIALAEKIDINQQNIWGQTILHQAVYADCRISTFDFLVEQGADLNARAYGRNAEGRRDKNISGLTPVMVALLKGQRNAHNYEIAFHLITRHSDKIDFTIETKMGATLLMLACKQLESDPDNDLLNSIVRVVEERKKKDI
jgi:hypothetical protein